MFVNKVVLSLLIQISFSKQNNWVIDRMFCKSTMDLMIYIVSSMNAVLRILSFMVGGYELFNILSVLNQLLVLISYLKKVFF